MKKFKLVIQLFLFSIIVLIHFSCTPVSEETIGDNFFMPIDSVGRQNVRVNFIQKLAGETKQIENELNNKKMLRESFIEQDKYIVNIVRQVNLIAKKESIKDSYYENNENIESENMNSSEILLGLVRRNNQRLMDVSNQLKHYADNRQSVQPEPSVQQKISTVNENSGYADAIQLYRRQKYVKAIRAFKLLLDQGIDISLQDNCCFWIGVCYFNLKETNRALNEFFKVLEMSDSDKKEDACFMIGQCYERMGIKSEAIAMFRKIILDYPEGNLKQEAEIKLALLR